ncbi:MAG: AI-2E family transporter [Chloroflexota bacterium]|nr:AI-2E family transporter [Chloroflexota bacterium]
MSESVLWRAISRVILFTIAVLIGLRLLSQISAVIVRVVLAVILSAGMKPLVDRLTARELRRRGCWTPPRGVVVLVVYVAMLLLVTVVGGLIIQVVVLGVTNLVNGVPAYGPRIAAWANDVLDLVPGGRDLLVGVDVAGQTCRRKACPSGQRNRSVAESQTNSSRGTARRWLASACDGMLAAMPACPSAR